MNETVRVSHKLEREKTIQDHTVSYRVTSKKENITMNEHRRAIVKLNKNILKSAYRDRMIDILSSGHGEPEAFILRIVFVTC